ncbi:MAG: PAS domain-containing protein [Oscillochloridaceae bacterium umkhey_bin13]
MARSTNGSASQLAAENEALRREVARYRALIDQLRTGVHIYHLEDRADDHSLRMLHANPAVEHLTGVPTADQIGKTLDENFPGLREQGIPQAYAGVVVQGEPFEAETVYGDERVISAAFRIQAVPLPNNEVAVFFENITEQKRSELELKHLNAELEARVIERTAELARNQSLFQQLLDASSSAIYLKDLEGRFLLANQQAANLMGLTPDQLVGRADHELFPAEYVTAWRDAEAKVQAIRAQVDQEETAPQIDGLHTFLSSRAPVFDEHGQIYAISGISLDITSRIKIEQALRESQQLLSTIFDHLPLGMMLKDAADGRFVLWNHTAEQHFGAKAEAVLGKTDHEIFPAVVADALWAKHQAVLAAGRAEVTPEEIIPSPQLGPISASITRVPIFDQHGQPIYMLIITADLTEQKRAADERAALQAQIIEAQQHTLRELSTPLLPIADKVVLMPIVGAIDSRRAQEIMETLLQGVASFHAEIAIVDITGVQVVDTQVANAFIQAARAVQLLGAQVLLTGIRPEVAQTLVQLGVDLQGIVTRGSLQTGIAYALKLSGMI